MRYGRRCLMIVAFISLAGLTSCYQYKPQPVAEVRWEKLRPVADLPEWLGQSDWVFVPDADVWEIDFPMTPSGQPHVPRVAGVVISWNKDYKEALYRNRKLADEEKGTEEKDIAGKFCGQATVWKGCQRERMDRPGVLSSERIAEIKYVHSPKHKPVSLCVFLFAESEEKADEICEKLASLRFE